MNGNFELITPKEFAAILHRKRETIPYLEEQYDDFPKAANKVSMVREDEIL